MWSELVATEGRAHLVLVHASVGKGYALVTGLSARTWRDGHWEDAREVLDLPRGVERFVWGVGPAGHVMAFWAAGDEERWYEIVGAGPGVKRRDSLSSVEEPIQVAVDSRGNGVLLHGRLHPPGSGLWARRWLADGGWCSSVRLDGGGERSLGDVVLSMDEGGAAFAAWSEPERGTAPRNGIVSRAWTSRMDPVAGWSPPRRHVGSREASGHPVSFSHGPNGTSLFLWVESDGEPALHGSFHDPVRGWDASMLIGRGSFGTSGDWRGGSRPGAVDPTGGALVCWVQDERVVASWFRPGDGWTPALPLHEKGRGFCPKVLLLDDGSGFVAWTTFDAGRPTLWVRRHVPSAGWADAHAMGDSWPVGDLAAISDGGALLVQRSQGVLESRRFVREPAR